MIVPHTIEGVFTFTATDQVVYTWFPHPIQGGQNNDTLVPPTAFARERGWLSGVTARVPTGGGITLGDTRVILYRDLRYYADGSITPPVSLAFATARDERKLYVSALKTPTPSATVADWDDRIDPAEPFENGFWIVAETSGGSGSGEVSLAYRINVNLAVHP